MLGSGRTTLRRTTRVISVNHREVPAGLVVDEVLGFRRFMDHEYCKMKPGNDRALRSFPGRGLPAWR